MSEKSNERRSEPQWGGPEAWSVGFFFDFEVGLVVHLFEQGPDFLGLARVERVGLEEVEHQQAGLPLIELVNEALDPLLLDVPDGDDRPIGEGLIGPVALDDLLGLQPVEQGGDRGVRPRFGILVADVTGRPERFEDLSDRGLAPVPQDLQDVQLGIGDGKWRLGHDRSSHFRRLHAADAEPVE